MWAMPASKLTRVRSEGFSNTRAMTRPGKIGSRIPLSQLGLQIGGQRKDPLNLFGRYIT